MKKIFAIIIVLLAGFSFYISRSVCIPVNSNDNIEKVTGINMPDGFIISFYAKNVNGARSLSLGENGVVFAGTRSEGRVYALIDRDGNYAADETVVIADNLTSPNGVAYRDNSLFIAEINRVIKFDNIIKNLKNPGKPDVVNDSFPDETHHGWKYIKFGPDNMLYVPVGAPCNICAPEDPRFATIMRMNKNGSGLEIFAEGVRNTVGFDWHPETKELWFTDNGRDWMGNSMPPDELNRAPKKGMHFGFPFCHGSNISDPEYGDGRDCSAYAPPAKELGTHVAALGMIFYTGKMFPEEYRNAIFIAEHGSWNRNPPIGYRVSVVKPGNGVGAADYKVFADGWLKGKSAWGRPVDILQMPDGSLLVSDDRGNAVYRIAYKNDDL